jgi:heme/copper-type cytochrome/quinol oxidase subunit 1
MSGITTHHRRMANLWSRGLIVEWLIAMIAASTAGFPTTEAYLHDDGIPLAPARFFILATMIFGSFVALYRCWPSRRLLDPKLIKLHFWGTLALFNLTTIPMLLLAIGLHQPAALDPRILSSGNPLLSRIALVSLCLLAFYQLPFFWAVILSLLPSQRVAPTEPAAAASASALRIR